MPARDIAKKNSMQDLTWFFRQWVWQTALPSYRLEWSLQDQPNGSVLLDGTLFQDDAARINFGGDLARTVVLAYGPQRQVQLALPQRPNSVELDPELWILSSKRDGTE